MPKISVIIPVYNTEKYLHRCLHSLCAQSLQDLEIICINDACTDHCPAILEHYARQDSRIRILSHEKNAGESAARNTGIAASQGDYIGFVDSDDWIDAHFYETLYTIATRQHSQITKGHLLYLMQDGSLQPSSINAEIKKFQSKHLFYHDFYTAIYKSSLIKENNLSFPEHVRIGPDIAFLSEALTHTDTFSLTNKTHYYYLQRPDGALRSAFSVQEVQILLQVRLQIMENIKKSSLDYTAYFDHMLHMHMITFFMMAFRTPSQENRLACAKAILTLYSQALFPEHLDVLIQNKNPHAVAVLKNNNPHALVEFFSFLLHTPAHA